MGAPLPKGLFTGLWCGLSLRSYGFLTRFRRRLGEPLLDLELREQLLRFGLIRGLLCFQVIDALIAEIGRDLRARFCFVDLVIDAAQDRADIGRNIEFGVERARGLGDFGQSLLHLERGFLLVEILLGRRDILQRRFHLQEVILVTLAMLGELLGVALELAFDASEVESELARHLFLIGFQVVFDLAGDACDVRLLASDLTFDFQNEGLIADQALTRLFQSLGGLLELL